MASQNGQLPPFPLFQGGTLSHSREDILERLSGLLGPPAQPEKLEEYTEYHASHYQLPAAYIGVNPLIRETLNNLITNAPENWQTSVLLPFRNMPALELKWDEIQFNRAILPRTPYESSSRMQTSIRRTHRDRVVRRGAAVMAESDFYRTEAGLKQFTNELLSIQQCVQITCNYDVIYNILVNSHYPRQYELQKNLVNTRNLFSFMRRQIATFAVLQKSDNNGFDLALETARRLMAEYNVTPDMLVVDPATMLYLRMVPAENKLQYLAGEAGVKRFNDFNASVGVSEYRGLRCYSQGVFDIGGGSETTNLLRRSTQVGEYYVFAPPSAIDSTKPLPPTYMDRFIYDETKDMRVLISFEEVVNHSFAWRLNLDAAKFKFDGTYKSLINKSINLLKLTDDQKKNLPLEIGQTAAGSAADGVTAIVNFFDKSSGGKVIDCRKSDGAGWGGVINLVKMGIWVPVTFVVARPFIEHTMMSMIVTVGGQDTGVTVFGHSDFQISANTNNKTIEGHYTFHSKAVVTKPQNIFVLEDVQCVGYVAGADTTWFGDKAAAAAGVSITQDHVIEDLKSRLHKEIDDDASDFSSMFAFAAPYEPNTTFMQRNMFSIGSGPLPWESGAKDDRNFPGGADFLQKYIELFNLNLIYSGVDPQSVLSQAYMRNGTSNNAVCILGPSRAFNPILDLFELVPGQGHFGADARPGDAQWRRGDAINAKVARENTMDTDIFRESQLALGRATR